MLSDFKQVFQKATRANIFPQEETTQLLQLLAWGLRAAPAVAGLWHVHIPGLVSTKQACILLIYYFSNPLGYYYILSKV